MYLDKLKRTDSSVRLTSNNFQRLLLVSIMTAAKFFEDEYYSNSHWAEIGGLSLSELNDLELEFLFRIAFNLNVKREQYDAFVKQMREGAMQLAQARRRSANMLKPPSPKSKQTCSCESCTQRPPVSPATAPLSRHNVTAHARQVQEQHLGGSSCTRASTRRAESAPPTSASCLTATLPHRTESVCSKCTTLSPSSLMSPRRSQNNSPDACRNAELYADANQSGLAPRSLMIKSSGIAVN
jgi:hypothetical protein